MFNLLPDSLKSEIIKEYKLRLFIISLIFVVFIELSFIVFLSPSFVISYYREKDVELRVEALEKSSVTANANSIKPIIKSLNSDLNTIDKTLQYAETIPIIDAVISEKNNFIQITDISYISLSTSTATIVIQGVSLTRDSLVNFKKSLEDSKNFRNIDLPISNLAKDRDIKFSMTMISNVKI